jgi:hypothetical protein
MNEITTESLVSQWDSLTAEANRIINFRNNIVEHLLAAGVREHLATVGFESASQGDKELFLAISQPLSPADQAVLLLRLCRAGAKLQDFLAAYRPKEEMSFAPWRHYDRRPRACRTTNASGAAQKTMPAPLRR